MSSPNDVSEPDRAIGHCRATRTPRGYQGVLADSMFRGGEIVLRFGGSVLPFGAIRDFTYCLEIADGVFLGPSGGTDDFVNHSCDPNCRVEIADGATLLRAVRDIAPGEEITYDYSTLMLRDPTSFSCDCGAARCRGRVASYRTLPRRLRRDYERRKMVPDFVLRGS